MKRKNEASAQSRDGKSSNLLKGLVVAAPICLVAILGLANHAPKPGIQIGTIRGTPINAAPDTNLITSASLQVTSSPPAQALSASNSAPEQAEFRETGFDELGAFTATVIFEKSDEINTNTRAPYFAPKLTTPIPETIKALDNRNVAVRGFMLPLKQEDGLVFDFILLKNQAMCCYGRPPNANEWVHVRVAGKGFKAIMDQPVTISGRLRVAQFNENRYMLGLYQMDAQRMDGPANL